MADLSVFPLVGRINRYEKAVLVHGGAWFFMILFGYYVLRPIREQIGATYGIKNLSWLFTATFLTMLVAIPLYSVLVGRFHRRWLVPCMYGLFLSCLAGFSAAIAWGPESMQLSIACVLFVWISVYGLFVVSFFWSVMGDMLDTAQGRRIFGVIFGCGTLGGLTGSFVAGRIAKLVSVAQLLWLPMLALALGLCIYVSLERSYARLFDGSSQRSKNGQATGGNPFAGFTAVFTSRYLFAIALYILILATCGTNIYFQQAEIVSEAFQAESDKLRYFADVSFAVSILTLIFQFFVSGFLMRTVGLGPTFAVLPLAYFLGITALGISPTITVLAVISVTGRAAEYGICNPVREVLFTSVVREDRYKAKSFIDTMVRRSGDTMVGYGYRYLRESLGFGLTTISWAALPLVIGWAGLALFIGRENRRLNE